MTITAQQDRIAVYGAGGLEVLVGEPEWTSQNATIGQAFAGMMNQFLSTDLVKAVKSYLVENGRQQYPIIGYGVEELPNGAVAAFHMDKDQKAGAFVVPPNFDEKVKKFVAEEYGVSKDIAVKYVLLHEILHSYGYIVEYSGERRLYELLMHLTHDDSLPEGVREEAGELADIAAVRAGESKSDYTKKGQRPVEGAKRNNQTYYNHATKSYEQRPPSEGGNVKRWRGQVGRGTRSRAPDSKGRRADMGA